MASLFTDFLRELGVRHTEEYSDRRFSEMPFQSMFGLANLLGEYGVATVGIKADPGNKSEVLSRLPLPFLGDTREGFTIVTRVGDGTVDYWSQNKKFTVPLDEAVGAWNGVALIAQTDSSSIEPDYCTHHIAELAGRAKKWVLIALAATLLGFAMWINGLYTNISAWLVVAFDCAGLAFSWLLVGKALGIHSTTAEAVCSALEKGGCDRIAQSEAASFMGIFKWSEVGLAYFGVSLGALLMFPVSLPALAALNLLCLPYSFWSIWYQKFKAKTWCTLCVCVQATLWLLFFSYLSGGWESHIFAWRADFWVPFIVIAACFVAVLLAANRIDNAILKHFKPFNDENLTAP